MGRKSVSFGTIFISISQFPFNVGANLTKLNIDMIRINRFRVALDWL